MTQLITEVASEAPSGARAIKQLSATLGVSRATFYRQRKRAAQPAVSTEPDAELRQELHRIALRTSYGYRPMTLELRRHGLLANHKRVLRLMREESLASASWLYCHYQLGTFIPGLSESGPEPGAHGDQPTLGSRHHLYPTAQ